MAGVIVTVLYDPDVRRLKGMAGVWPAEFGEAEGVAGGEAEAEVEVEDVGGGGGDGRATPASSSSDSGLPPLESNPNQRRYEHAYSEDDED